MSRKQRPSEDGIYWVKETSCDDWFLAWVTMYDEKVRLCDPEQPFYAQRIYDLDYFEEDGSWHWYGPFKCPREGETIIVEEVTLDGIEGTDEVVSILHLQFGDGARVTYADVLPEDEAKARAKELWRKK